MSLFKNRTIPTPAANNDPFPLQPMGYGIVSYTHISNEWGPYDENDDEYDDAGPIPFSVSETVQISGAIFRDVDFIVVLDAAGASLHVPKRSVTSIMTHDTKEAFESYLMHADLEDAMGADA